MIFSMVFLICSVSDPNDCFMKQMSEPMSMSGCLTQMQMVAADYESKHPELFVSKKRGDMLCTDRPAKYVNKNQA